MDNLEGVDAEVRAELDSKYQVRESTLTQCRQVIRSSANAIRALHRNDLPKAERLIADVRVTVREMDGALGGHHDIRYAGFYYDAVKEYAEACFTLALLNDRPLPMPSELGLDAVPYLKGLGEAVGEQRRRMLDQLRSGDLSAAERTFAAMETIIDLLTGLDYPDGMTSGLRRTTDVARSLIERSRADLTSTIVQERLRERLANLAP